MVILTLERPRGTDALKETVVSGQGLEKAFSILALLTVGLDSSLLWGLTCAL